MLWYLVICDNCKLLACDRFDSVKWEIKYKFLSNLPELTTVFIWTSSLYISYLINIWHCREVLSSCENNFNIRHSLLLDADSVGHYTYIMTQRNNRVFFPFTKLTTSWSIKGWEKWLLSITDQCNVGFVIMTGRDRFVPPSLPTLSLLPL